MPFRFEGLEIWHKAREFSQNVNRATANFPPKERYALADQMNRASNAPALVIVEGSGLDTNALFSHRLGLAIGEICEVASAAFMALDRGYISAEQKDAIYKWADELARKINAFRNSLR
jgi:four helix bundle protein